MKKMTAVMKNQQLTKRIEEITEHLTAIEDAITSAQKIRENPWYYIGVAKWHVLTALNRKEELNKLSRT